MTCKWCESKEAEKTYDSAFWELPCGTRAVEITDVPSTKCPSCNIVYIDETLIDEMEDHFMLIDTKNLPKKFTFGEFMEKPRMLKRNYFKF
ncbi:YokU family protein [Evansella sp. AB-rgal1]|uniref:YokU family protein n=1 Tax=Evansella sp. AB-rgal1 TaxID=3242696 RepID=UPI00359D1590